MLSVGCGWHPGRHLFPTPAWRMTGADLNSDMVEHLLAAGDIDAGVHGRAGELPLPSGLVRRGALPAGAPPHRLPGPLRPCLRGGRPPAAPGRRAGGDRARPLAPGRRRPRLANRAGLGVWTHGTPDDVPLSPASWSPRPAAPASSPSCTPSPTAGGACRARAQRALHRLDPLGSRPRLAPLGHTLMLIGRRYSTTGSPKPGRSNGGPSAVQPSRS